MDAGPILVRGPPKRLGKEVIIERTSDPGNGPQKKYEMVYKVRILAGPATNVLETAITELSFDGAGHQDIRTWNVGLSKIEKTKSSRGQ